MSVPFVDLGRQFAPLYESINKHFAAIIARSAFINGPEIGIFE